MAAGGIGRHVQYAAQRLSHIADVTIVTPSILQSALADLGSEASDLGEGITLRVAPSQQVKRDRFASPLLADAAEVAEVLALIAAEHPVDLVEVDDYLGLGALLADKIASGSPGLMGPTVAARLHTTWEMTQVLDRQPLTSDEARWACALERRALRTANVLIAPNAATWQSYERYYGHSALGPGQVLPPAPIMSEDTMTSPLMLLADEPVRLLLPGRLEERKGSRALVQAIVESDLPVELLLAGGDTATAPDGGSMRAHLEGLAAGDQRIRFAGRLDPSALSAEYAAAHVVVLPSKFESFGYVLREALAHGRPVLATPTAGFAELMTDPRAGWISDGFDDAALRRGLRRVINERARLSGLLASGAPREALQRDDTADAWDDRFFALIKPVARRGYGSPTPAKATAVILADSGDIARSLRCLKDQDTTRLQIVVAAERASRIPRDLLEDIDILVEAAPDAALAEALAQRSRGGRVLLLRAGERFRPSTARRLAAALDAFPTADYATAWSANLDASGRPLAGPEAGFVRDYPVQGTVVLLNEAAAESMAAAGEQDVNGLVVRGSLGVVVLEELLEGTRTRTTTSASTAVATAQATITAGHDLWETTAARSQPNPGSSPLCHAP